MPTKLHVTQIHVTIKLTLVYKYKVFSDETKFA